MPAVTEGSSARVRVEMLELLLGGVVGFGLKLRWKLLGPLAPRLTADENVSIEPTVSDEVPDEPIETVIGETALREKSGTITVKDALPELLVVVKSVGDEACTLAVLVTTLPRVRPEFSFPERVTVTVAFAVRLDNDPPCELHEPPLVEVHEL